MIATLGRNWKLAVTALVTGISTMAIFLLLFGGYKWYADNYGTIVIMNADVVFYDYDSALIHMYGKKLNDCVFLEINAYFLKKNNPYLYELNFRRLDRHPDKSSKPKGFIDVGFWLAERIGKDRRINIFVNHDCSGVNRTTLVADVEIP